MNLKVTFFKSGAQDGIPVRINLLKCPDNCERKVNMLTTAKVTAKMLEPKA